MEPFILSVDQKLASAIEILEKSNFRNILVVNNENIVIGTVGNHEVRSALLSEQGANTSLGDIALKEFVFVTESTSTKQARKLLFKFGIDVIPILDESGKYLSAHTTPRKDISILIMAGGLGSRLYPLTNDLPKSLIVVAGKPVLAHIIDRFLDFGFLKFYISVSYKSELIMEWIEDNYSDKNLEVIYLRDPVDTPLGTAGALTLLPDNLKYVLVQNTDVLCDFDVDDFLDEHIRNKAPKTILASKWSITCPYGVVRMDNGNSNLSIVEKPIITEWINGGIYLLNRSAWDKFPQNTKLSMIEVLENMSSSTESAHVYRHTGEWIDMGSHSTLKVANSKELELNNE
jgi:dTDP-glucose pyrophosphorylase